MVGNLGTFIIGYHLAIIIIRNHIHPSADDDSLALAVVLSRR